MLTRAEQGQLATLLVVEPKRKEGKTLSLAIHEVLAQKGDKFQAFQCIREQVRDIFHAAHGNKDLSGNDSVYYALPKVMLHSEVLQTEEVQSIIQELTASGDGSAARRAEAYFKEIVSDRHYTIAKVVNWMVTQLFKRCFVNLELRGIEHIKELNRKYQVVYLPSHRSHLDFLTMSHLTYESGLEAPYIAASNHLNFFPVRYIQMVSGYFIRRKKMEPLYNAILYQYIKAMHRYGKSHMVFVEGTRSKTGEVLQPKAGIVSQYLNAYIEEQKRPLVFIPMNITYDFVLEGDSYLEHIHEFMKKGNVWDAEHAKAYEQHLSDRKNQGRWAKLKKLLQAFRDMKPQGSAYLTPGELIFLNQVLEEHRPDWADLPILRQEAIPDAWIRDLARLIVRKACTEINRVSPVTPHALISTALLASKGRALPESELRAYVATTSEFWQRAYGAEVKTSIETLEENLSVIPYLNQCRRRGERRAAEASPAIRELRKGDRRKVQNVFLAPLDSMRSTYSRNNIVHSFVIPHLISRQLLKTSMVLREDMQEFFVSHYELLRERYQLPWDVATAWDMVEHFIVMFEERGLLTQSEEAIVVNRNETANSILGIYARAIHTA